MTFKLKSLKLIFLAIACLFIFIGIPCALASDVDNDFADDNVDDMNKISTELFNENNSHEPCLFDALNNESGQQSDSCFDVDNHICNSECPGVFENDFKISNLTLNSTYSGISDNFESIYATSRTGNGVILDNREAAAENFDNGNSEIPLSRSGPIHDG